MADIKDDISLIGFVLSSPVSLALSLSLKPQVYKPLLEWGSNTDRYTWKHNIYEKTVFTSVFWDLASCLMSLFFPTNLQTQCLIAEMRLFYESLFRHVLGPSKSLKSNLSHWLLWFLHSQPHDNLWSAEKNPKKQERRTSLSALSGRLRGPKLPAILWRGL